MEKDMTVIESAYARDFDRAALDKGSPWLPTPPVADTEASETRGVVQDTLTERGKDYGDFAENAYVAQNIKEALRNSPKWDSVQDTVYIREALDLIASKIGRLLSGNPYHIDGWHDIAGYATLVEQRLNKRSI
jgi:hypothetical protein